MYLCDFQRVFQGGKLSCFPSASFPSPTTISSTGQFSPKTSLSLTPLQGTSLRLVHCETTTPSDPLCASSHHPQVLLWSFIHHLPIWCKPFHHVNYISSSCPPSSLLFSQCTSVWTHVITLLLKSTLQIMSWQLRQHILTLAKKLSQSTYYLGSKRKRTGKACLNSMPHTQIGCLQKSSFKRLTDAREAYLSSEILDEFIKENPNNHPSLHSLPHSTKSSGGYARLVAEGHPTWKNSRKLTPRV